MIPGACIPRLPRSQRATDFGDYPIANMVGNGWAVVTAASSNISAAIAAAAGTFSGRRAVLNKITSNGYRLIGWDQVPTVADIEVLARVNFLTAVGLSDPTNGQLTVRADPADGDPYYVNTAERFSAGIEAFSIGRGDGAGGGVFIAGTGDVNVTTGIWWMRFRVIGNTQKAKAWQGALSDEPSSWSISATDTNVPSAGKFGLGMFYTAQSYAVDWLSVGLNGATAPSPGG